MDASGALRFMSDKEPSPTGDGSLSRGAVRMVLRESAAVLLLDADCAFRALVSGFFTATGVFTCIRIDHVADTVIADLENIGADVFTDATPGAKIGIDFRNTHGTPPLERANDAI